MILAWAWIVPMARDMYGPMTGLSAWMMSTTWEPWRLLLLWLMWAVMMAAMMLPSAFPMFALYDHVQRRRAGGHHRPAQVYALAAGYLLLWALFSVGATALQRFLSVQLIMNPMMEMPGRTAVGVTCLIAGAYQLTPWKAACLAACRSPLLFLSRHWREGIGGAFRMGAVHGAYCLGCCWALMLLLFAGGVMNLTVIVGLTFVVLVEKVMPFGPTATRVIAVVLIVGGVWILST